ncbi:MAG: MFS transporter [Dehalococcoidia bacterium]|nr:MFS transporter [Dehalococcoidia bacterium]
MTSKVQAQSSSMALWTIRAVALVAFMDLFMQLPVVATYARSLGAAAAMIGVTVGMYSATNLLGNLGAGVMLDRMDRKRLVVIGMILTAASLYAYSFVDTPVQLLVLRAFHGLFAGVLAPGAFAMLGDRSRSQRVRSMGMSGSLIAVSAVIGPLLAGWISVELGYEAVFVTSATLMLVAALAFLVLVPGTDHSSSEPSHDRQQVSSLARNGVLLRVFWAVLVMTFGIGVLINYLPIVVEEMGGSARTSGIAFATFSLVATALMASPLHRVMDARSRAITIVCGLGFLGVSSLMLAALGAAAAALFPAMVIFGLGFGMLFPSLSASVADQAGSSQRGTAFGIFYAIYSLGVFVGAVVSGGVSGAFADLGAPFYLAAAVPLIAIPVAFGIRARQ